MITYRQPFAKDWPITQKYGEKITSSFHTGIDYGCSMNTPILASADGTVVFAGWDNTGYGNMVIINHGPDKSTLYAHLSSVHVAVGEKVKQGSLIGHSGTTGNSTGPHLHFEARKQWNNYKSHFDPMLLPLTTVYDQGIPVTNCTPQSPSQPLTIPKPRTTVQIVCPDGAFAHNLDFTDKRGLPQGTQVYFTGNTVQKNGLTFCECVFPQNVMYIAAHNNDTQILS